MPDLSDEKIFPKGIKVRALFDEDVNWRLIEDFGPESFTKTEDGRLLFTADYLDLDSITTWFMTFGDKVEVIEPEEVRDRIQQISEKTLGIYKE